MGVSIRDNLRRHSPPPSPARGPRYGEERHDHRGTSSCPRPAAPCPRTIPDGATAPGGRAGRRRRRLAACPVLRRTARSRRPGTGAGPPRRLAPAGGGASCARPDRPGPGRRTLGARAHGRTAEGAVVDGQRPRRRHVQRPVRARGRPQQCRARPAHPAPGRGARPRALPRRVAGRLRRQRAAAVPGRGTGARHGHGRLRSVRGLPTAPRRRPRRGGRRGGGGRTAGTHAFRGTGAARRVRAGRAWARTGRRRAGRP